jgi:hypothetical protein
MGNFYVCYFGQPIVAFCITAVLSGFFIGFYSIYLNGNTARHNGLLTFFRETSDARNPVFVISILLSVIMFFTAFAMLSRMVDGLSPSGIPSPLQINISLKIYLIFPILVLFFYLQPRVSEKKLIKRQLKQKLAEQRRVFDQHIVTASKYDYSQGLTKVMIAQILASLFTLKSELPSQSELRGKRVYLYELLEKTNQIEERSNYAMQRMEALQEKEKKVYQYINAAESVLFQKSDPALKEKINLIRELIASDILKAYEFTNSLEETPKLRSVR